MTTKVTKVIGMLMDLAIIFLAVYGALTNQLQHIQFAIFYYVLSIYFEVRC